MLDIGDNLWCLLMTITLVIGACVMVKIAAKSAKDREQR